MSFNKRTAGFECAEDVSGYPIQGSVREVVTASAATLSLTGRQSGALVEVTKADGVAITLPDSTACLPGTYFDIVIGVTLTADVTVARAGSSDVLAGVIGTAEVTSVADAGSDTNGVTVTFDQSANAAIGNQMRVTLGGQGIWYFLAASPAAVGITVA